MRKEVVLDSEIETPDLRKRRKDSGSSGNGEEKKICMVKIPKIWYNLLGKYQIQGNGCVEGNCLRSQIATLNRWNTKT